MKASNAYQYFWAVAIILGFLACIEFVSDNNSIFDVNIDDTYYVIAHTHIYTILAITYFTLGLVYRLAGAFLGKKLTALHTTITVGSFIAYFILWAVTIAMYDPENIFDRSMEIFNMGVVLLFLLVTAIQLLLPINVIIGLVKRNR
jgi:heme/copper-type cytochrome/quinol oxidase subunit 1